MPSTKTRRDNNYGSVTSKGKKYIRSAQDFNKAAQKATGGDVGYSRNLKPTNNRKANAVTKARKAARKASI